MYNPDRAIVIILDGVGIGGMPDAGDFGDLGSNTLGNLAKVMGGLSLPNLEKLGLGNIVSILGINPQRVPLANYGKMAEKSPGKDSTTGHWEIAGCILDFTFPTYPNGFPASVMDPFRKMIGRGVLGNKPASGTEIIKELGTLHIRTGYPIVYTSADSVFQIAAHEDIISVNELYEICKIARELLKGDHAVSRVIARPFIGDSPNNFVRTPKRKDFSLKPPKKLLQNCFQEKNLCTVGIGKIDDLYAGVGLDKKIHTKSNKEGIEVLLEQIKLLKKCLLLINLVDFDMLWGHRNNPQGFYRELQQFDQRIPEFLACCGPGDVVFITADHGNDPTTLSTDHSREYVPLLVYGKGIRKGKKLGIRRTFSDLGKTIAEAFNLKDCQINGTSFWKMIN